jgi:hypothetical protein
MLAPGWTEWRDSIEVPRWDRFPATIRSLAKEHAVDLTMAIDKGWLRETVEWTVRGVPANVQAFRTAIETELSELNASDQFSGGLA